MAPVAKNPMRKQGAPQDSPPGPDPRDLWSILSDWLRRRFGILGVIVLASFGIWWQWNHINKLPGIDPLLARITQRPLPTAIPGKFNIAIAHLEGDTNQETERLIRESLAEFKSVTTLSFDRTIVSHQGDSENDEREGQARARALLASSNADVLIWGIVLRQGGKSLPKIYWTTSRDSGPAHAASRYQMTEDFSLPAIFWQDLTDVLALLVATSQADIGTRDGRYQADTLAPFIRRVRTLLRSSKAEQWNAATRAKLLTILGNALTTYSDQSGLSEPLLDAIAAHQEALAARPRDGAPLDWAASQNYLGNALVTLGQRETRPARLNAAVEAYRNALQERTRDKGPLNWAATQNNLGYALRLLGQRESDPTRLNEAIAAFRAASQERSRERVPLYWAATQNNLGVALWLLGQRKSDAMLLDEAIAVHRAALQERTREKVPLYWATTQNNLGNALRSLGQQRSDAALLNEALAAYRAALEERTRNKMPLEWATTQNNLGLALAALGQQESNPARLIEAVAAYREALLERTREKAPLDWALTQNNLGNALRIRGQRESDTARLYDAKRAYDLALAVFREAGADYYVQFAESNLQRVRRDIAQRTVRNVR
jgi:Tetratricopeptide repeat